jgi:hypothetical protein
MSGDRGSHGKGRQRPRRDLRRGRAGDAKKGSHVPGPQKAPPPPGPLRHPHKTPTPNRRGQ